MSTVKVSKNDQIMMSLVHYFVTKENYAPINVQGAKDEIWLENLNGPYRVIRINTNTIINEEQYKLDLFKIKYITKQIKRRTLSFKINVLNICLDISSKVDMFSNFNIDTISIDSLNEIKKSDVITNIFPNIKNNLIEKKDSMELIMGVTNDINEKTEESNRLFTKIFSPKKIIITKLLIGICVFIFLLTYIFGKGSTDISTLIMFGANNINLVKSGEIYRLVTAAFLHIGVLHLIINMYSLFIIGKEVENVFGKLKFTITYLFSAIVASLFSIVFNDASIVSAGASGAIFGLLGALLYFGYHFRLYLTDTIKTQIVPIIIINLVIGVFASGIDLAAHIGGLIGGYLMAMILGIEAKTDKKDSINGIIVSILLISILVYVVYFIK